MTGIYTAPQRLSPLDDELFRRLCRSREFLAEGIGQPLRLADAAREACLSPHHYQRVFARTFGETPHEFLTRLRIDRAKRLLPRWWAARLRSINGNSAGFSRCRDWRFTR